MERQQIPREYHSGRLTTFVSYLRKSGFKQNNCWKRIYFNEHIPDHGHTKNRLQEAAAHLRAKTKYKMVLEVTVQIQLKVTSIKCLLCIGNRLALNVVSFNTLSNTERPKLLTPLSQMTTARAGAGIKFHTRNEAGSQTEIICLGLTPIQQTVSASGHRAFLKE